MENIVLLGATGSIGRSTLDIIRNYPERFHLLGVSGFRNYQKLSEIVDEFSPRWVWCEDSEDWTCRYKKTQTQFFHTQDELCEMASAPDADTIIIGIAGIGGLLPTVSAILSPNKKRILTANKESIVSAGDIINALLLEYQQVLIPLDSEHSAIFNLLNGVSKENVESICLTASGGPFRNRPITPDIRLEDVLNHPTWDMGNTITVNSATMMNKGFEVIEAHYLFGLDYSRIRVLTHPQSLVHGMLTLTDGSVLMAASSNDMRIPIANAMFYPALPQKPMANFDFLSKPLEFFEPDWEKFPLLGLSYEVGREGGVLPCVLNAANETAVDAFLNGQIPFIKIPNIVKQAIQHFQSQNQIPSDLDTILRTDQAARDYTKTLL